MIAWIQFEFLRQLSSDSNNIVIGLVRNKAATDQAVAHELAGRSNIHILEADITDYEAIKVTTSPILMPQSLTS